MTITIELPGGVRLGILKTWSGSSWARTVVLYRPGTPRIHELRREDLGVTPLPEAIARGKEIASEVLS